MGLPLAHNRRYMDLPAMHKTLTHKPVLPAGLMTALHAFVSLETEWLTDSLHTHTTFNRFHSAEPTCAPFGALPDPYLHRWYGCGLVQPVHAADQISKALKWSINCTLDQSKPTLLVFCAPRLADSHAASKLYSHPHVHRLVTNAKLPDAPLAFSWSGRAIRDTHPQSIDVLLVANLAGKASFLREENMIALITTLNRAAARPNTMRIDTDLSRWRLETPPADLPIIKTSKAFQSATSPAAVQPAAQPAARRRSPAHHALPADLPTERNLQFANMKSIFTDGSKDASTSRIGSGVYIQYKDTTYHIEHAGHDPQLNTVPRAEATGLLIALQKAPVEDDIVIFTDCLGLIQNLQRLLNTPTCMRYNKNIDQIQQILHAIVSRTGKTSIYKVRAHAGVEGNEKADAAAKAATGGAAANPPANQDTWIQYDSPTTARAGQGPSWARYPHPAPTAEAPDAVEYRSFDELRHHTKRYDTQVYSDHVLRKAGPDSNIRRLNSLNFDPLTPSLSSTPTIPPRPDQPPDAIDLHSVEYPMTAESIPPYHLNLALRVRFKVFETAARANLMDPQKSALCPLCHAAPETIGHYLGACPRMTGIICKRHGQAVEIIKKAIKDGGLGGCPIYSDAETGERSARQLPRYIPQQPPGPDRSLPDIYLVHGITLEALAALGEDPAELPPENRKVTLFEIGYTQDLSLPETLKTKHGQHQHLKAFLETRGWTVSLVVVPISYTGLLLQSLTTALTECGVDMSRVTLTKNRLIAHSLAYNNKIQTLHDSNLAEPNIAWDPG